ncbi:hypothetical protein QTI24_00060 [Variovorax sp. J22P240]|uniref:hypothetical protein n=1 Tax=Variovorax sp. J22P240 TaxID=3053514 RepID=UPI002578D652|nr:hypothetical protein [Variovorax sp. J22P240]MDL9996975.1 hypothetical protein [Variovorax sp. J22P240]
MHRIFALATVSILAGCATPSPQGAPDKNASYQVTDGSDGFTISVAYSRYQFIPESSAVQAACKQALTAGAFDEADRRGRKIEPVNEQRIRLSMGRNGFTGITSCEASVSVTWAK